MKKLIILTSVCNVLTSLFFTFALHAQEQQNSQEQLVQKLIIDPKIRYGQLDNGLTYYIRRNEKPKERAEFYIVHNVGSMQEEDNQKGLAHFLEHMAFNGSKNFPAKDGIKEFGENLGLRFGESMNAYTSFDETVYMLMNVPVTKESVIDSCLLVLHDWSSCLLLDDEMIEKERGVIREEWRTTNTAQMRLLEQQIPKMYPKSRYGNRLPIGELNIIENFKRSELVDYYQKWYRPDLQAIIIVGDINVDQIEQKIIKTFKGLPKSDNPESKEYYIVPDNPYPLISIAKDKEMTNTILSIYYKHEKIPLNLKGTIVEFYTNYNEHIIAYVMQERFSALIQKPDPPFLAAYAKEGDYFISKTKGAWTSIAVVKPGEIQMGMQTLVQEIEKLKQFGISEAEYERAKESLLKQYENAYNEKDNEENSNYAQEYVDHFTNGDYIPGIEVEYDILRKIAPAIPLEGINHAIQQYFTASNEMKNIVIGLMGPDKSDMVYPSEEELFYMFMEAKNQKVESNEEKEISKILVPDLPVPGKIVAEQKDALFDTYVYTLSNGVKVILKPTTHKKDEILMSALSPGGESMFKDKNDIWNLKIFNNTILLGGLGTFDRPTLEKVLTGRKITFNYGLSPSNEIINGSATIADMKTLFELIYLQFTALRKDPDAFASFKERVTAQLENLNLSPDYTFSDTLRYILYDNHPKNMNLKVSDFDKINYNRIIEMYRERFADASDFVFTFVGNITVDSIRPLLEQYIATLPAINRVDVPDEKQVTPFHKGIVKKHYAQQMETPKATVNLMYTGEMPYSFRNIIITQIISNMLDLILFDKVRENENASYSVRNSVDIYDFPMNRTSIQIKFNASPVRYLQSIETINSVLNAIANEGPENEYFQKSIESIMRRHDELIQNNDYWLNIISMYYFRNLDTHTDYLNILKDITKADIQAFTKELLGQQNKIELVMIPQ